MAVWQFVFDLVPASSAQIDGVSAVRMSRDQLDEIRLEFSRADADLFFAELSSFLPEKKSWSPSLRIWGDEKLDDIQVGLEGQFIQDVQFRLNAADLSLPLIGNICLLARRFGCLLATRDGAIMQPYCEAVVRSIMQSRAMQFVRDPQLFLEEAIRADHDGA